MPSTCRSCCCSIRSGQQVMMCSTCADFVHLRCLPVSCEEAERIASLNRWDCVLCEARHADEQERQLIQYARQHWLNERLDDLINKVMELQQEQDDVSRYVAECSESIARNARDLTQVEQTVDDLHSASKNSDGSESDATQLDPGGALITPQWRRGSESHKASQRKMVLHNLGSAGSRRADNHKTRRLPKMSMSLGVLISQLIIMECN